MSGTGIGHVEALLWPDGDRRGAPQVYWLLDGARDPAIETLLRQGGLEYTCLYDAPLAPRLRAAAPYLVHLAAGSPTTATLLERGLGRDWGVFCVADPQWTLAQQRRHFKKLLRVGTEDGRLLAFRFYDPRVLASVARIGTDEQLRQILGPLRRIVLETGAGWAALEASGAGMRPRFQALDAPALVPPRDHAAAGASFEQAQATLQRAGWSAAAVGALLPQLARRLPSAPAAVQRQWFAAVRANWTAIAGQGGGADPAFALGVLAGRLQWWGFAAFCFARSLETDACHVTLYNRAIADWQLADHAAAQHGLRQARAAAPANPAYRRQSATLARWRTQCRARLGGDRLLAYRDAPQALYATLLGPHHAQALASRQDDPELLRLARLPRLDGVEDARRWIQAQADRPGSLALALLHPEFGQVGVCAIERHGHAALFHYWIARPFQGQGHGGTALRLLKRAAIRFGIRHLYGPVFESNARSLGAMRQAGFARMPDVTDGSADRLPYFCFSYGVTAAGDGDETRFARLQGLLRAVGAAPAERVAREAAA
jgi:RimJ/RimL family protein N-acetyltransferase